MPELLDIASSLGAIAENYGVGATEAPALPISAPQVGTLLETLGQAPPAAAPVTPAAPQFTVDIGLAPRRGAVAAPGIMPWGTIEEQPGFQALSADGKRQIRAQYLVEVEKLGNALYKKPKDRAEFMEGALTNVPDYKNPTRTTGDWINDLNLAIQGGVSSVTGGLGEAALGVGGLLGLTDQTRQFSGEADSLSNLFNPAAQDALRKKWDTEKSAAHQDFTKFKAEREAEARAAGRGETGALGAVFGAYTSRPSEGFLLLAEQIPVLASFIGPAGYTKALTTAPKLMELTAALRAGKMTEEAAAKALVAIDKTGTNYARLVSGSMGAALESSDAKQSFVDQLTKMPDSVWNSDPEYQDAIAGGEDKKAAKERLARDRSGWATGIGALLGIVDGISGFERMFIGPMTGGMKTKLANMASEPVMESLQGINPLGVANLQAQGLDPKIAFNQGFGPAVAEALVVALPLGGATVFAKTQTDAEQQAAAMQQVQAIIGKPPGGAEPAEGGPPGPPGAPPGAPVAEPVEMPSAIGQAQEALTAAQDRIGKAGEAVAFAATPAARATAQKELDAAQAEVAALGEFVEKWNNVKVTKDLQADIARDERRIAALEADPLADADAKAREIGALQGRIESKRALEAVNTLDENQLQAYIDSRNQSLAAASTERGLGITVDKARLTNEIAHAQRLLEERAEIPTPPEVAFKERAPTVFERDPAGVPIWPETAEIHNKPFRESLALQRDKALSLINLVRGNPQFTRSQRTTAITRARAAWEAANRVDASWNLSDEELAAREADLTQAIGSGLTGATGYNPGHMAELAGVIAAQASRRGEEMTYREALQQAQVRIGAIYIPPSGIVGPGAVPTSVPDNPAGDTSKTYFYDDKPYVAGGVVVTRTSTEEERKLWNAAVRALVKAGFPQRVLDTLGIRIATTEHPSAAGLYVQSALLNRLGQNPLYTVGMGWAKFAKGDTKAHQWTASHEVGHAIADSQRNGTDLSEIDARFLPGGELHAEIVTAWGNGKGALDRFFYPLSPQFGYNAADTAAELWAQSTAYYFVDRNVLKQHAPKTFAFVEKFYADLAAAKFADRQQLGAEVRRLFSGVPPAGVAGVGPGGPGGPGAGPVAGPAGPAAPPAGAPAAPTGGEVSAGVAPTAAEGVPGGASPLLSAAQGAVATAAARATSMLAPQNAATAQGRLAADAIATVEAQLAQEQAPRAARDEGTRPVEPARGAESVSGVAAEPAVAAAPAAGEAAEAPAPAPSRRIRPPAKREKVAPRRREKIAAAKAAEPLAASAVKVGDRATDEGGDRVTVTEIKPDGTIFVRGAEGFEYESRVFPADSAITPFTQGAAVTTTAGTGAQTKLQVALSDQIVALEDHRASLEGQLQKLEEQLANTPILGRTRFQRKRLSSAIASTKNAIAAAERQSVFAETLLANANWMRKKVGVPSSPQRMVNAIAKLLGITTEQAKALPTIEYAFSDQVDPQTGALVLANGERIADVGTSVVAFYLPERNKLVFIVDNIPKGQELTAILHEMFHKRGRQLLGRELQANLRREVEGWRNYPEGSIERKIWNAAMPKVNEAVANAKPENKKAVYNEELLPYFITEAARLGVKPQPSAALKKGAEGWMARISNLYRGVAEKIFGRKIKPEAFTANELIAAAWGAAQLEKGAVRYELMARGQRVAPPITAEAQAASFLKMFPRFEARAEEIRQRRGLRGPEAFAPKERRVGGAMSAMEEPRLNALSAAPKAQVVQAAAAAPAVGPAAPQFSIAQRFAPTEAKAILTTDELSEYLRTGNRPTVDWMQQTRDRQVENYIDHQRPFLSWLKRHALPLKAWAELKLVPGRLKSRGETYSRELLAPLERGIAKLAKNAGIPMDRAALDVGWWATLRHIPEANAALRQKFQNRVIAGDRGAVEDLRNHDIAQRGQGKGPLAGGLSNTQAASNMAALENRYTPDQVAEIKRMGDEVVAAFAKLKEDAVASGQISKEALREFPKFKHYVALTGPNQGEWDNQASDAFGSYIAENRLREREGRTESVANSSVEALADRIGRVAAYDASREFKQELNTIYERAGGENNTIGLERFTANLVQSPKKSDMVWNAPDGKRYVFRFSEGAAIGESLLGKNREYHETLGLKAMDYITRKFSRAVTQWIIAFGPINAIRDIQEKAILIRSRDVVDANGNPIDANAVFKATWKYWLNPDTWRAAKQLAFSANKRADESTQIGRYSNEMVSEGGASTWGEATRKGLDSIEASIKEESRRAGLGRGDLNSLQKVEDFVRNYNLMFEIMSSLSVNAAMRDLGVSRKDAAFQTLDLMNFQNVGARAGWLRAAFSFFNPAAQSGYNLYRQIMHSKRGRRDFIGLLALSFALQGLLRLAADDDEDLGNELDQKGTWEVERNVSANILGVPLKMPIGFGAPQFAWSIMNSGYRWMSGRYNTADAVAQAGISVLKSFNPIPISEVGPTKQPISFLIKTFTPTVFRPAVDFMTDSDAWGGKLTAYYPDKTKFRSEQGRPTTSVFYKDVASGLKDLGMDLYPEQVKALGDAVAWGPFGYILQGVADWNKENEGRRLNAMDKLPASAFLRFMGASRFIGGESRYLEARYYETYDKALNDLREFNEAKTNGREPQWRSEHPEKSRRVAQLQTQETTMRGLSKEFNSTVKALQNETLNVERARPALERIQNKRETAMREFLKNLKVWQEHEDDEP